VARARATDTPAMFWLDPARAHDAAMITKVWRCRLTTDQTQIDPRLDPD